MLQHLPNILTLCNLLSGSLGVLCVLDGDLTQAAMCIWLGGSFDFLDGFLARLLNATSAFGKQLDALADLITFGVLPSTILYALMQQHATLSYLSLAVLALPVGAAWRLARFNTTKQQAVFLGLPSPVSGLLVSTLPFIIAADKYPPLTQLLTHPHILSAISLILSVLLVAPITFMALKFKTYTWTANKGRYSYLAIATLLLLWGQVEGLALSMLLYLLWSLLGIHTR